MTSVLDYSTTAGDNTTVGGVNIAEGMAPGLVNNGMRAMMADTRKWQLDWSGVTTAGAGDAYTLTSNQGITAYADGQRFSFRADRNNTGAATLNIDTRGAKALRKVAGGALAALVADDLVDGAVYDVVYNLSEDVFVIVGFALPTISALALTLLDDATQGEMQTTLGLVPGANVQAFDADLTALAGLSGTGIAVRTASNTWAQRQITSTGGTVAITNPAGVAGDINLEVAASWTFTAQQATTSGATKLFSGIPSGVNEIIIIYKDVSLNSPAENILVQLGDAGGLETSGYVSDGSYGGSTAAATNGFILRLLGSSRSQNGILHLYHLGGNEWVSSHATGYSHGGGTKTLSAELTQLQIMQDGAATFDNGAVQIGYK